jgi:hypothetical protein
VWAVGRLAAPEDLARLHAHHGIGERDGQVAAEWAALGYSAGPVSGSG